MMEDKDSNIDLVDSLSSLFGKTVTLETLSQSQQGEAEVTVCKLSYTVKIEGDTETQTRSRDVNLTVTKVKRTSVEINNQRVYETTVDTITTGQRSSRNKKSGQSVRVLVDPQNSSRSISPDMLLVFDDLG